MSVRRLSETDKPGHMPWLRSAAFAVVITMLAAGAGLAQHLQPYAGQQDRAIAGLSADEVKAFLDGRGMGLAKPAEVNGYPGPMHVLELADELKLTGEQRQQVQLAFERMKTRAVELGARYVAAEKALDEAFKSGTADAAAVATRVAEANRLLGEVRMSHLAAHIEITPLLSAEQRALYAERRGYGSPAHTHKNQ